MSRKRTPILDSQIVVLVDTMRISKASGLVAAMTTRTRSTAGAAQRIRWTGIE